MANKQKAEKCAVAFLVNGKHTFTLVKTMDQKFNEELMNTAYLEPDKRRKK